MIRDGLEPVAVPHLGRIILVPAALAHAFALAGLFAGWSTYRWAWAAVTLLVASSALPVLLVAVPRRRGGRLPPTAAALIALGVLGVSVAGSALLPPEARSSLQSWHWGTGAMTILGMAMYLSIARTLLLAAAHAGLAVAVQLLSGGGAWRVHLVLVSTLIPPVGAAQYVKFYTDALRQRARAVESRLEAESGRRELDVVRRAGDRRLDGLRTEIEPLLEYVASGGRLPLDEQRALRAHRLAERLRAALLAQRRALWLPEQLGEAPVVVICSDETAHRLGPVERAWLAALIDLLDTYRRWREVRVVLDPRSDGSIGAVVTAEGPAASAAAADARIQALAAGSDARLDLDGTFLAIDADLHARIGA